MWLLPTVRQVTRFAWYLCLLFAEITNACINYRNPVNHPGELNRTITKNGECGLWDLNVGESYTVLHNGRVGHDCMCFCSTWVSFDIFLMPSRLWSCRVRFLVEPSISYYRSLVSKADDSLLRVSYERKWSTSLRFHTTQFDGQFVVTFILFLLKINIMAFLRSEDTITPCTILTYTWI